jgi:hypothetical protein
VFQAAVGPGQKVIWQPQPGPQTALLECPIFEVFYGGARGGGKTEGSIGDWLQHSSQYGEHAIGIFVRRKLTQLSEVIARTKQIFVKLGAKYNEQQKTWTMPQGGRLKFVYLERDSDAEEYQGHSYTRIYVEELTNFPSAGPIDKLRATLRSGAGVPVGMRLTGNPGGPGHLWVRARYIDPAPGGYQVLRDLYVIVLDDESRRVRLQDGSETSMTLYGAHKLVGHTDDGLQIIGDDRVQLILLDEHEESVKERVYIPSRLGDNRLLMENDPLYVLNLRQAGSEALVKAWLAGDWSIIDGAFFDEWSERIILPMSVEGMLGPSLLRFRAFDWGSARPFSVGWYALLDKDLHVGSQRLPKGALVKYREWYGAKGPNMGLKMTADMVAQGIWEREKGERIRYGVADPSIFVRDGGPSIAETMAIHRCQWRRADNKRRAGWEQMHLRLRGEFGTPMLYFLETCEDSIRTIPLLQHDEDDAEDVDTEGEDHAGDETRYAVMSRPWQPRIAPPAGSGLPKLPGEYTITELIAQRTRKRLAEAEA